jgi:hypothetical protein
MLGLPKIGIKIEILRFLPLAPCTPELAQAEELVWAVMVTETAEVPDTVAFGTEKQALDREGLLETLHATVPV